MARCRAFTLIEVMIAIAIMAALFGIVFAVTGPARERARETVCTSNLHQIGRAYALYAADHDGTDPVVGVPRRYFELGLPSDEDFVHLRDVYIRNRAVLLCPSYHGANSTARMGTTYIGYSVDRERWANEVAKRGPDVPLWECVWHNPGRDPLMEQRRAPRWTVWRFNILRLGGHVSMVKVHGRDEKSWEW